MSNIKKLCLAIFAVLLALICFGCTKRDSAGAAQSQQELLIDPAMTLHEVPAIRGVMTEWIGMRRMIGNSDTVNGVCHKR